MAQALFYSDDFSESHSFEIEFMDTFVNGESYILRIHGEGHTIEVILDEAAVIEHNRLTLEFIKGYTYGKLHRNGTS